MVIDKHLEYSEGHLLVHKEQLQKSNKHPYKANTFPLNITHTKKVAVHKDINMPTKPVSQNIVTRHTACAAPSEHTDTTSENVQEVQSLCSRDAKSLKGSRCWKNKGHKRMYRLAFVFIAYTVGILLINGFRSFRSYGEVNAEVSDSSHDVPVLERDKRFVPVTHVKLKDSGTTVHCIPRSVENFPCNFMTEKDTREGGFVIHVLVALYVFAAIAIICDDYFVPSLEHICEDLGLQADVAGATFMAAGSSAPEFMTSVIGVFFAKSDVGVGTIVGSAVFNILFIVGVCGLFAGMVVDLTWYPLVRDTLFYLLSVLVLYLTINDRSVEWYEATLMIVLYCIYIVIMYFNRSLEKRSRTLVKQLQARLGRQSLVIIPELDEELILSEAMKLARAHSRISQTFLTTSEEHVSESEAHSTVKSFQLSTHENQTTLLTSDETRRYSSEVDPPFIEEPVKEEVETVVSEKKSSIVQSTAEAPITVSEYQSVWEMPENFFIRCIWVAMCPIKALYFISLPDSRRPGIWARLYIFSFAFSVLWISGLTYIMVWMVTVAGDALDIPDTVMGLTFLAAGTSVPDCLASVFVARDGYGDMAVSNSLGSNVFDILICLGVPWVIECATSVSGVVHIDSGGLTYSTLTLLTTVVFLLASMGINKWRLTKAYGFLCLGTYVVVITLSCLFELNIFADINPPSCAK